jgi:hypothetical protein
MVAVVEKTIHDGRCRIADSSLALTAVVSAIIGRRATDSRERWDAGWSAARCGRDVMAQNDFDSAEKPTLGVREIRVFLCYRRQDGAWYADWLYRQLNNTSFIDAGGDTCQIRTYYDMTAPGVSDWKQLHFPSLQTSQAMILVCTPGIAIDFSKRREPDWVYEELRWWSRHRETAPIVVDTTSEGDRWLPRLITHKWPDINRIDLSKDDAAAAEGTNVNVAQRIRERITGAIRESERRTVFEDLRRFKRLTKRLSVALLCAVVLFFVAVGAAVFALRAREAERDQRSIAEQQQKIAEEQTKIVEEQNVIMQKQVIKLLFLPSTEDSDRARDSFIMSTGELRFRNTDQFIQLAEGIYKNYDDMSVRNGVLNALRVLECVGPYKDPLMAREIDALFSKLGPVADEEVKLHLEVLRTIVDADRSNRPRPVIPGYDRCEWARDAARKQRSKVH